MDPSDLEVHYCHDLVIDNDFVSDLFTVFVIFGLWIHMQIGVN